MRRWVVRASPGFTLIELMIVVAIIAVIAGIAIPNLLSARLNANETSAIASMRSISSAQAQFQASAYADVDNDGAGEFGMFTELSGAASVRVLADGTNVGGKPLNPPVLPGAFRTLNGNAEVSRSGYLFKMFVAGAGGAGVGESPGPGDTLAADADPDLSETTWCCYAWPATYGNTGSRTFFVSQTGDITAKDDGMESGTGAVSDSHPGIAFTMGGGVTTITGLVAVGTLGRDGYVWKQAN